MRTRATIGLLNVTLYSTTGVQGLLRRLIPKLWRAFPRARIRVRLDGGFAAPAIFDDSSS